ncbi:hypothetical protein J437_LFUL018738 [Ladona fulva]|uniref:Nucleolar and spindle-associated protein 1 n=1 Tax=Ladona fulva TaxID=123851 RepID=A0A8K0PBT0_LADFU|nr:hypothetical protein J437_LFUL018738 [Ladona fulva]
MCYTMQSVTELESLDYRELQKLAKSRNIRQSGKGVTKKRLVSLLWTSMRESESECSDMDSSGNLPLKEVPVETVLPISSSKDEQWKQLNLGTFIPKLFILLNVQVSSLPLSNRKLGTCDFVSGVDLNESNKENNIRRLTFEVVKEDEKQPPPGKNKTLPKIANKSARRVKIIGTPTNVSKEKLSTPKPPMKIVRTPAATRSSRSSKLPSEVPHTPANKTPRSTLKTPATTKTVALRLAASAKKTELTKTQSRIPKLNPKKLPNFASIHQTAFDKMDSLWDVEKQRVTRMKQVTSNKHPAVMLFAAKKSSPVKKAAAKKSAEKAPAINSSALRRVSPRRPVPSSTSKVDRKELAKQAANKTKPQRIVTAKDNQRTFLKGVRINKRFEMQMKNRGLM